MGTSVLSMEKQASIILFDGVCNLCNGSVNFIIDRDKKNKFRFASLQSAQGRELLGSFGFPTDRYESIILIQDGVLRKKSTAILHICKQLSGLWPLFFGFILLPAFIRDFLYDIVAKNRYRWFGKLESCRVPTPELRKRFLEAV